MIIWLLYAFIATLAILGVYAILKTMSDKSDYKIMDQHKITKDDRDRITSKFIM